MKKWPFSLYPILRHVTLVQLLIAFVFLFLAGFYIKPFRNLVLHPVWPRPWRDLTSTEVIMVNREVRYNDVTDLKNCPFKRAPNASVHSAIQKSSSLSSSSSSSSLLSSSLASLSPFSSLIAKLQSVKLREERHRAFLPLLTEDQMAEMLRLYSVFADALRNAEVEFFFMDGSLLGLFRHGGFIPWDDDIDIGISVRHWPTVRDVLSCIDGFTLTTSPRMHWKFHPESGAYPFVDIFFYTENDKYLWAITSYTTTTLVLPLSDVFPLKTAKFENFIVPVPGDTVKVIDRVYRVDVCSSSSLNHNTHQTRKVVTVPCSTLEYMYPMKYT